MAATKNKKRKNRLLARLGVDHLPPRPTVRDYEARIDLLTRKAKSGKYQGVLLRACHKYIGDMKWRIRKANGIPNQKKHAAKLAAQAQPSLPGFLNDLNVVRIEELVAQNLAKQIVLQKTKRTRRAG